VTAQNAVQRDVDHWRIHMDLHSRMQMLQFELTFCMEVDV